MRKIILSLSFIALHTSIIAQSDPVKPNHNPTIPDSTIKEIKFKDSDEDAMEINHDRPADKKIIKTVDDQPARPDTNQIEPLKNDPKIKNELSMRNGKVMSSENGTLRILHTDTILPNGIKVKNNGTIITPDGSKFNMTEGQVIDMTGNLILTKDSIQKRKE